MAAWRVSEWYKELWFQRPVQNSKSSLTVHHRRPGETGFRPEVVGTLQPKFRVRALRSSSPYMLSFHLTACSMQNWLTRSRDRHYPHLNICTRAITFHSQPRTFCRGALWEASSSLTILSTYTGTVSGDLSWKELGPPPPMDSPVLPTLSSSLILSRIKEALACGLIAMVLSTLCVPSELKRLNGRIPV